MINQTNDTIKSAFEQGRYFDPYISSGMKNKLYTLRASMNDWNFSGEFVRDIHITNLSNDPEQARAKALELTGQDLSVDGHLGDINRRTQIDPEVLEFGKYQGERVADIAQRDPDYLVFIIENDYLPRSGKVNRPVIEAAVREQLNANIDVRNAARDAMWARCEKIIGVFGRKWLEWNVENTQGFTQDVSRQLLEKNDLSERQLEILTSIRAKQLSGSRKGSKAYQEALEQLEAQLEAL